MNRWNLVHENFRNDKKAAKIMSHHIVAATDSVLSSSLPENNTELMTK